MSSDAVSSTTGAVDTSENYFRQFEARTHNIR